MDVSKGLNIFFVIDELYGLCYVDLVVNISLFNKMNFNVSMVN